MTKPTKKKPKKSGEASVKSAPKEPIKSVEEEKPFDFGGLPDRDLKKNLGCG